MTAIAGVLGEGRVDLVERMLAKMIHRGRDWQKIVETGGCTLGLNGTKRQTQAGDDLAWHGLARDGTEGSRFAEARIKPEGITLKRDTLGVAPLYYGWTEAGEFCFASEVKGLLVATRDVHELPPGHELCGDIPRAWNTLTLQFPIQDSSIDIAFELRRRIEAAVEKRIGDGDVGSWLSGGLDSSIMAALACQHVDRLHTFAAGMPGAADLEYARRMADHIHSEHHEVVFKPEEIIAAIPEVIYYLESFDALLVRSSILNYLAGKEASNYVSAVFSGEGGDELFAGYEYLKGMALDDLPAELLDITYRLHNTALQRVDRCASDNGVIPHVCFLDPDVLDYALQIPAEHMLHNGVEKWILRQAAADLLPPDILNRKKAKFWEGSGVNDFLARHAEERVSTHDFKNERELPNGWRLNSKEELLNYRVFKEHFGLVEGLSWMGRTKGAPSV